MNSSSSSASSSSSSSSFSVIFAFAEDGMAGGFEAVLAEAAAELAEAAAGRFADAAGAEAAGAEAAAGLFRTATAVRLLSPAFCKRSSRVGISS